jgi:adenylate cyclase
MAAGGVPDRSLDHAVNVMEFAIEILENLKQFNLETGNSLQVRVGINSGPVIAGVIGTKKIAFDLWGDTVNGIFECERSRTYTI